MNTNEKERLRGRLIELTKNLVSIESTDSRPEERERCFQIIRHHVEEEKNITLTMHQKEGYESLVIMPEGIAAPKVLFCAHLDVVEHPHPDHYQAVVRDGKIMGPGAGDMKGQIAILLELFRRLHREQPGISVGLVITSDEERGGENGVKFLVEELGLRCGVAIIPDGGSLNEVTCEEKGILHLNLVAHGHSAHAARPWLGKNPLVTLVAAIIRIRSHFEKFVPAPFDPDDQAQHWFPTCALTKIDTPNESPNRIPEVATATFDVRFPPPHTVASMRREIEELAGDAIHLEVLVSAEATHLKTDLRFVEICGEVTGIETRIVRACGGSDARFFCAKNIPVLLSRPFVGSLHGHDEWIDIDSMLEYFEICWRYVIEKTS